ncbi:MAG: hypothetical protein ABIH42_05035 [Planctomycetota bacterium]
MNNNQSSFGDEFRYLIKERIKNFWGYGNLCSDIWFVGMEEGLEPEATLAHLAERFRVADGKVTTDMRHGMENVYGHDRWFNKDASVQPTWKYPIALYLYFKNGYAPTKEEIRDYQALKLGNSEAKETVTVELMPLPSNKARESTWLYGALGISGLSTRTEYLATYKPERVRKLRELFHIHKPKLAIFYSLMYLPDWTAVIGSEPEEITKGMYFAKTNSTACCIIPQSASFGMSYMRLYEFAKKVRDRIQLP